MATHEECFIACAALANVRLGTYSGLKSDIAESPESADNGLMRRAKHALLDDSGRTGNQSVGYVEAELLGCP